MQSPSSPLARYGMLLVVFVLLAIPGTIRAASPVDKIVEFYISSIPNPPRIDLDWKAVWNTVETGDIIIENNRAFPQWYAMIGSLVPNCQFVHAGMIIKGHLLKTLAQEISPSGAITMRAYYRGGPVRIVDGKPTRNFEWQPYPVDSNGTYVVTPEVTINTTMSRIVVLNLRDYLVDPAIGFSTKHIRVIRPRISSQDKIRTLAKYLTYHVLKRTSYDMGFDVSEKENAICRTRGGELWFDMSAQPVPLYCTELVWRALREVGIEVPTTQVKRGIATALGRVPRMPRSVVMKMDAAFVTADVLMNGGTVIYQNAPPPTVKQAVEGMVDLNFKATCQGLVERFTSMLGK